MSLLLLQDGNDEDQVSNGVHNEMNKSDSFVGVSDNV